MINGRTILLILVVAVVFGVLMSFRASLPFGWLKAIVAALAFVVLGLLLSYLIANRK